MGAAGVNVQPGPVQRVIAEDTLGAAGAMEAVISILSLNHQCVFPNLNFSHQMNELDFSPVTDLETGISLKHIMSNSFGFGGNNTTLIISRYA